MNQIGLLLQLVGFLLVGIFAGILLEREVVGRLVDKARAQLSLTSESLKRAFLWPVNRRNWEDIVIMTAFSLGPAGTAVGLAIAGESLWWIALFGLLAIPSIAVMGAPDEIYRDKKALIGQFGRYSLVAFSMILFWFVILPPAILRLALGWLAHVDVVKRLLIVFGTLLILTGTVLQFIATFR